MTILGIDPGLAIVGYGVLRAEKGVYTAIDCGVVNTPKEAALCDRLTMIYEGVLALIERFRPDQIALEELFFTKNITTGIPVAEARGVILLAARSRCDKLFEYTPMQIKQALTGYGKADKTQVQYMVTRLLRLKNVPKPDDAADALAVALTHAQTERMGGLFSIR